MIVRMAALAVALVWAGAASAQAPRADRWQNVVECRAQTDPAKRLACMDAAIAAAEAAERSGEMVVIEKSEVERAAKEDFGLRGQSRTAAAPRVMRRPDIRELRTTVTAARLRPYEKEWVIALADGSVWRQIGNEEIFKRPRPGLPVEITRGLLNNFFLVVDGATAIRVRRIK